MVVDEEQLLLTWLTMMSPCVTCWLCGPIGGEFGSCLRRTDTGCPCLLHGIPGVFSCTVAGKSCTLANVVSVLCPHLGARREVKQIAAETDRLAGVGSL